jgi:ABC-type nitrate/sulfonate/bicarbonate transport system substrate-binding protein
MRKSRKELGVRSEANKERLRCTYIVAVSFICLLFCSGSDSLAQDKALRKINWGMTALSASMWIPWLAKEARIYEKNGLDVEIVLLRGSGQSSQALLAAAFWPRRWRCRK